MFYLYIFFRNHINRILCIIIQINGHYVVGRTVNDIRSLLALYRRQALHLVVATRRYTSALQAATCHVSVTFAASDVIASVSVQLFCVSIS